ncbi:hypothetical protein AMTR_s00044p00223870 [Amborella trichopoda]|uniref:Uncharacterized protein n=1 Tax=Amborella trichopoda TaxID=13333 RepID=U5D4X6_AMBTC|nr:hypothetical protein AMTR_s00044p00223870 [Amborella trichopoda]
MAKLTNGRRLFMTDLPIVYTAKEELDIDSEKYLNLYLTAVLMDLPSDLANQAEEGLDIFKDTMLTNWDDTKHDVINDVGYDVGTEAIKATSSDTSPAIIIATI